jgi:hypothetical protein
MFPSKALLVTTLAFLAVAPSSAQPWEPSALIVWMDGSRREALFVPQTMLPSTTTAFGAPPIREVVPMRSSALSSLASWVERVQNQRLKGLPGDCIEWGLDSYPEDSRKSRLSLTEVVSRYPATFTGRVRAVQQGLLDAGSIAVGRRVDIEIQEVIRDTTGRATVGRVASFFQAGGTVEISGISICMDPRGAIDYRVGETALVVAYPHPNDETVWLGGVKLLVEHGVINSERGFELVQESGLTVSSLRAQFAKR